MVIIIVYVIYTHQFIGLSHYVLEEYQFDDK